MQRPNRRNDNEQDKLRSADFTITNAGPDEGTANVEFSGSEYELRKALPARWHPNAVLETMDEPTVAKLERTA